VNPFEKPALSSKKVPELNLAELKTEAPAEVSPSAALARPFLTQLNKVNLKVERLLSEKARLIENTAIEKSRLITKLEVLKAKNADLEREKDLLAITLAEKEQEIKKHFSQETVLGETLMITQEIFRRKEEEIRQLNGKIEKYERELVRKNALIQKQNMEIGEIGEMIEKQNNKWWKFWNLRLM
jgi:chromosome segregation ATPase